MTANQVWFLHCTLTDTSTVSNIHTAVDASESTLGFGVLQRNTLARRLSTFQVDDHKFVDTTRVWRIYYFGVSECLPGSFRLVKNPTGAVIHTFSWQEKGRWVKPEPQFPCEVASGRESSVNLQNQTTCCKTFYGFYSFKLLTVWQKTLKGAETCKSTS